MALRFEYRVHVADEEQALAAVTRSLWAKVARPPDRRPRAVPAFIGTQCV